MEILLFQILLIPAIGGLLCLILYKLKGAAEGISVASTALTLYLAFKIYLSGSLSLNLAEFEIGTIKFAFSFHNFGFNGLLGIFASMFGFFVTIYSLAYFFKNGTNGLYYAFTLFSLTCGLGVLYSENLLPLLIFWELSAVFLFFLTAMGKGEGLREASTKVFSMLGIADLAMLVGVVMTGFFYSTLSTTQLSIAVNGSIPATIYILFLISALAKAGAFPLHSWIPAIAPTTPSPVMAFLPAALDKLLGIYLLWMISLGIFQLTHSMKVIVMAIGAITIIMAVMMALIQHNLKKLLSFHAVSQVGYMVLGVGTGTPVGVIGGLFHMINHALYKSTLFYGVGCVEKRTGRVEVNELGGLGREMPITLFSMIIASFAISGVPPLNGFVSKWLVYQALVEINQPIFLILAIFGSALTLASFIKVLYSIFWGQRPGDLPQVKEVSILMWAPVLLQALLCLGLGIFAQYPITRWFAPITEPSAAFAIGSSISFKNAIWNPTLATGLILVGIVLGIIIYLLGRGFKVRESDIFTLGEKLGDKTEFKGGGFYNTIRELGILKGAYSDGEKGVFDIYNITNRIGSSFVNGLRALHNGVLSNYLSWAVIGLGVILFLLIR